MHYITLWLLREQQNNASSSYFILRFLALVFLQEHILLSLGGSEYAILMCARILGIVFNVGKCFHRLDLGHLKDHSS